MKDRRRQDDQDGFYYLAYPATCDPAYHVQYPQSMHALFDRILKIKHLKTIINLYRVLKNEQ